MLKQTPKCFISNPFAAEGQPMMIDLIALVLADSTLPLKRRREVCSCIRRFCEVLGVEPRFAPANHWWYRERLKQARPRQLGLAPKTWSNIRSGVAFGLRHSGIAEQQPRYLAPLSPAWQELKDKLGAGKLRYGLSRLTHFCSALSIRPDQIDDKIMALFLDALRLESFVTEPEKLHRNTCRLWNRARLEVPDWPDRKVTVPVLHQRYCLAWESLPATFRKDAEEFLTRLSGDDPLAIDGPPRPARPATIAHRRFAIRQLVSGLCHRGHALSDLTSLRQLVEIETVKEALRFHLERADGKPTSQTAGLAQTLLLIAKYHCRLPEEELRPLAELRNRLRPKEKGLRPRNRERLAQFRDERNIIRLLAFSQHVYDKLRRKNRLTVSDARLMEIALAVELELMLPLRRMNLVRLRWGNHIRVVERRRGKQLYIHVEGSETKNGRPISGPLPSFARKLLEFWIERCRPLLMNGHSDYVFPGARPGTHLSLNQFSRRYSRTLGKELGLDVHLHLMRHIGSLLYLNERPGNYEVVRRVLGHAKLSSTMDNYVGLETDAAVEHFDQVILAIRDRIRQETGDD